MWLRPPPAGVCALARARESASANCEAAIRGCEEKELEAAICQAEQADLAELDRDDRFGTSGRG